MPHRIPEEQSSKLICKLYIEFMYKDFSKTINNFYIIIYFKVYIQQKSNKNTAHEELFKYCYIYPGLFRKMLRYSQVVFIALSPIFTLSTYVFCIISYLYTNIYI